MRLVTDEGVEKESDEMSTSGVSHILRGCIEG